MQIDRRDFLKLMGLGSAVFVLSPGNSVFANGDEMAPDDFFFIQLSDTHWGFTGPKVNPDSTGTLKKAVAAVNSLKLQPDFIMFTGDLTHVTDDDKERRTRLAQFRDIIKDLKVKSVRFMPGEHDAGLDEGEAFKEFFGETHYTFDHKGVHFIVLDNVSDPGSNIGESQLRWMSDDLKKLDKDSRIIVFTHRPLFDLYPDWDWYTRDGAKAIELLKPYSNVTVFYGHIHQENHHKTDQIWHHAAKGLMFPLPAPGSVPKKMPIPWDDTSPYKGLGFRGIEAKGKQAEYAITEFSVKGEKL
jgi:3',5'-cyclic AMP phosphodiesterase CpdA